MKAEHLKDIETIRGQGWRLKKDQVIDWYGATEAEAEQIAEQEKRIREEAYKCKLCKKGGNEVTMVHVVEPGSSLTPGYCTRCQQWVFLKNLFILCGSVALIAQIIKVLISGF